ncbi:MAG: lysophospholipid acyltransferase family protein [Planctomycetota bacterium]
MRSSLFARVTGRAVEVATRLLFGFTGRHAHLQCRWHLHGPLHEALREGRQVILAAWHQDVLPLFHYLAAHALRRRRPFRVLASRSAYGEVTARILRPWGFRIVRGSRGKAGGPAALRGFREALERGESAVVVADGPGPPPFLLTPGVIFLARRTGVPLYVARGWARPQLHLHGTWFRLALPLPFCHVAVSSDGPIPVTGDPEAARQRVQDSLNRLCAEVDDYLYENDRVPAGVSLEHCLRASGSVAPTRPPRRGLTRTWSPRPRRPDRLDLPVG